jgi:hypothetical protein
MASTTSSALRPGEVSPKISASARPEDVEGRVIGRAPDHHAVHPGIEMGLRLLPGCRSRR